MMELEDLKQLWQSDPWVAAQQLSKEELMQLLQPQIMNTRDRFLRRLKKEISWYIAIFLALAAYSIFVPYILHSSNFAIARLVYLGFIFLILGAVVGILAFASQQVHGVQVTENLRDSLGHLIRKVSTTMKVYLIVYMVMCVTCIIIAEVIFLTESPRAWWQILLALITGIGVSVILYRMGKNYLAGSLGKYKLQLTDYFNELKSV